MCASLREAERFKFVWMRTKKPKRIIKEFDQVRNSFEVLAGHTEVLQNLKKSLEHF